MAEMLWGFKSPLSHRLMRKILLAYIFASLTVITGCIQTPEDWFAEFNDLQSTCMTPISSEFINNLDYLGQKNDIPQALVFEDGVMKVFGLDNLDILPDTSHPDHVIMRSVSRPDYSVALDRRGWTYCVNLAGSTSLFMPIRRISY